MRNLSLFHKCPYQNLMVASLPSTNAQFPFCISAFSSLVSAPFSPLIITLCTLSTCSFYFLISVLSLRYVSPFPLIIKRAPNFKRLRAISPKARSLRSLTFIDVIIVTYQRSFQFAVMRMCLFITR